MAFFTGESTEIFGRSGVISEFDFENVESDFLAAHSGGLVQQAVGNIDLELCGAIPRLKMEICVLSAPR